MANIKMTVCYDGTNFLGWQKTIEGPSIQESLEKALSQILQTEVSLEAASRTDAGVHAKGQVVNFTISNRSICLKQLQRSLNALLNHQIKIMHIEQEEDSFHPTLDNIGKEYHYFISTAAVEDPFLRHTSWHFNHLLDLDKMRQAASALIGTKDFSAFCNDRARSSKSPICRVDKITIEKLPSSRLCIAIAGNRFLYKMVRNIVGTLAYIGSGKIDAGAMEDILTNKMRQYAGVTAPAHGLFLQQVFYPADKNSPM